MDNMRFAPYDEETHGKAAPLPNRRSRNRGLRFLLLLFFVLCGLIAGGFAAFAHYVSGLRTPANVSKADAIIVLTGGQWRLEAALDLLKEGKAKRLLISGVHPSTGPNAIRAATGSDIGLFSCCVDIDREALDTIGNAQESVKWLRENRFESAILVTNNYHMPRSLLEINRIAGDVEVTPYPVVNTRLDNGRWLAEPGALRVLVTEYVKYVASLARGMLPLQG
ncbi:MAG: YdcF family protein [Rhizobiaceae bacterium]|nr:YdcF family protein [Rhizobiaceae bacterium]